jgi:hypothetical protein
VITIDAPNYRIRYSDDEIPTDRAKFLLWCRATLWDNVKNARLYKSYDEALHKGQDAASGSPRDISNVGRLSILPWRSRPVSTRSLGSTTSASAPVRCTSG